MMIDMVKTIFGKNQIFVFEQNVSLFINKLIVLLFMLPVSLSAVAVCGAVLDNQTGNSVGNQEDSVKVHRLKELIVEGKDAWIEGDKAVFLPSKRDKKLSNSVGTLLERMKIPTLIVEGEKITNIRGKSVAVFINGVRADEIDYSTFWPKQALRVEYMENPSDQRFEGVECAINFIMKAQETGGVARVKAEQQIRNEGNYSAAAKIEHKKMTYGVMIEGAYSRDHLSSANGTESYNDIYYEGMPYERIERSFNEDSYTRSENIDVALNARYRSGNTTLTHVAALRWNNDPGSGNHSLDQWIPDALASRQSSLQRKGHSVSPQFSGKYVVELSRKWWVSGTWKYAHARNQSDYLYRPEGVDAISNATVEDVNSIVVMPSIGWNISSNISTYARVTTSMDWYDTKYSGSADTNTRQHRGSTIGEVNLWWKVSDGFTFNLRPGVTVAYWKTGEIPSETHVTPKCNFAASWSPSKNFNTSAYLDYYRNDPTASVSGDVIVRQTELLWTAGNPFLKGSDFWSADVGMTWLPAKWMRIFNSMGWSRQINGLILTYKDAGPDMGGLVRTTTNGSPFDSWSWDMVVTFPSLFNDMVSLSLQPTYRYYNAHGEFARRQGWFRMRGSVEADMGDFHVGISYGGPEKYIEDCGTTLLKTSDDWAITATYGTGDWYFNIRLDDVFNSRKKGWAWIDARPYASYSETLSNGRCLRIDVSYTFGFGKKINRNIKVTGPEDIQTGVIKM